MKYFIFIFALIISSSVIAQEGVVGGAGRCPVSGNPNLVLSLRVIDQRQHASEAVDTTSGDVYNYKFSLPIGSRWVKQVGVSITDSPTIDLTENNGNLSGSVVLSSLDSTHIKQGAVSLGDLSPSLQDSVSFNAYNGLRKDINGNVVIGSASSTSDASKLTYNTYMHMDGRQFAFLGDLGAPNDVMHLYPNGNLFMGADSGLVANRHIFAYLKSKQAFYLGRPTSQSQVYNTGVYGGVFGGLGCTAPGAYASSIAGQNSIASGVWSCTLAGNGAIASGASAIAGGLQSLASGDYSVSLGGRTNQATGLHSSNIGGRGNIASGIESTVGGGDGNTASGEGSTVPGGQLNIASGENSTAFGIGAIAASSGSIALGLFPVSFAGQTSAMTPQVGSDLIESIGNSTNTTGQSNARTTLKNGSVQFNHVGSPANMSETQARPITAFEFTSTSRGLVLPRLSTAQITTWQSSFNITTDQTGLGGAGNEQHSRRGELVFNTTTGKLVQANWNGSAWFFTQINTGESLPSQSALNTFIGATSSIAITSALGSGFAIGDWIYWNTGAGNGILPLKIN
jgi:hypothetical protein